MNPETELTGEPLLQMRDVVKTYSTNELNGGGGTVLSGNNLRIYAGDSIAITGPSGSGKSTLLNLMGGLDEPSLGTVSLRGQLLTHLTENQRALLRSREIGFVFQFHHLLPHCTALENILLPTAVHAQASPTQRLDRARSLLARTGLEAFAQRFPSELSGGERQRVAVLRALINSPAILLAYEPTCALDADTAQSLAELLCELQQTENLALVLVTHSPPVARHMARQWTLLQGHLEEPS